MSPEPIINLQRRLALVGSIRAGGEKPERGVGKKLEAFRLTSRRRDVVEQAAELYGGPVSKWRSPVGDEWQVYTEAEALPVLVMPAYSLRQTYELWEGATKRTRLCDGIEEELTGGPCLCNAEGKDECDLYSRLVVALPELDSVLGWRLITRGANAAHELPTMMALAERAAGGAVFVPAQLRLDSRRGVKDGQVVRFVVPVLDLGRSYLALAGSPPAGEREEPLRLPSAEDSFTPAEARLPTVEQALSAVAAPALVPTGGRQVAALDDPEPREHEQEAIPVPDEDESYSETRQTLALTEAQAKKLNVLVGKLRESGQITTEHLWRALAEMRGIDVEAMVALLDGRDGDDVLHWAPLRNSLTRVEATVLIDRLSNAKPRPADLPEGY